MLTPAGFLPLLISLLPLAIVAVAMAWKGRAWSTREVPGAAFRLGIGALFAACVVPAWGLLAAQAAAWWWVRGWVISSGGLLWPTAAAVMYVGLQAPTEAIAVGVAVALAMGVVQTLVAMNQRFQWAPILLLAGRDVVGTLGHRTGLAIYLGMLVPLSFSTDYAMYLAPVYVVGLVLARSSVGYAAAVAGLMIVLPQWWPVAALGGTVGVLHRFVKRNGPGKVKTRLLGDAFVARFKVWRAALSKLRWPYWLIGRGGDSFHKDGRTWIYNNKLSEQYKEAHNDYVEFIYEYGLCGLIALGWYVYSLRHGIALGDPASGALAGMAVASLGNFPVRVAPIVGLAALCLIIISRRLM